MVFKLVKWVRKRLHNTFWMFKLRCFIWKETVQLIRSASVSITHAGTRTIHINFILYSPSLYNIGCILVAHTTKCCFCAFNHSDYHNRLTRPDHFNAWLLLFFFFFYLGLVIAIIVSFFNSHPSLPQALETDLTKLFELAQETLTDPYKLVLKSPVGLLQRRRGGESLHVEEGKVTTPVSSSCINHACDITKWASVTWP